AAAAAAAADTVALAQDPPRRRQPQQQPQEQVLDQEQHRCGHHTNRTHEHQHRHQPVHHHHHLSGRSHGHQPIGRQQEPRNRSQIEGQTRRKERSEGRGTCDESTEHEFAGGRRAAALTAADPNVAENTGVRAAHMIPAADKPVPHDQALSGVSSAGCSAGHIASAAAAGFGATNRVALLTQTFGGGDSGGDADRGVELPDEGDAAAPAALCVTPCSAVPRGPGPFARDSDGAVLQPHGSGGGGGGGGGGTMQVAGEDAVLGVGKATGPTNAALAVDAAKLLSYAPLPPHSKLASEADSAAQVLPAADTPPDATAAVPKIGITAATAAAGVVTPSEPEPEPDLDDDIWRDLDDLTSLGTVTH
ncbi:hypothetical protein VaNZ11_015930, partial [Volvox africanus]